MQKVQRDCENWPFQKGTFHDIKSPYLFDSVCAFRTGSGISLDRDFPHRTVCTGICDSDCFRIYRYIDCFTNCVVSLD